MDNSNSITVAANEKLRKDKSIRAAMENKLRTLKCYKGIYAITKTMSKNEKGYLYEIFTYHSIKHSPSLNNGLEKLWMYYDIPKNVKKLLNLPSKDKGIDLLAVINGEYYAIQCKFRQNPDQIISWSELSTFFGLSFGMSDKIKGGILVTNTKYLCQEVINSKKVIAVYDDFFDDLASNFFENIMSDRIEYECKYKNMPQIECVTAARVHFLDNARGTIEMACGTGKTLASYWIASSMSVGRTVVFVPSLQLLSQFYSDWVNQSYAEGKNLKYLLIGSDADVNDDVSVKSNGIILQLDPIQIHKHLSDNVVVICTYQSSDKLAEACDKKIAFDFGIFDEAHKTVGQKGKQFSRMLSNEGLMIRKRLFMTATPKIYMGKDEDIMSMDDKDVYGDCFYKYNTGEAIEAGLLTDYRVLSIYASDKAIEKDIRVNKLVKFGQMFDDKEAKYLATILIVLKKITDGTINHLLTYHGTVARAEKFADFLSQINKLLYRHDLYVASLDGRDSMRARKNVMDEFEQSKAGVICSARVLNEGVNIPIVDSVCFVDDRESPIDITQCIGRCLRLYDGKKIAHVIVPVFVEDFDKFDKIEFGSVIKILQTMKNTDEGIVEYFVSNDDKIIARRKSICCEHYNVIDVSKEINIHEWESKLHYKLWKIVDLWGHTYKRIEKYVRINGYFPLYASIDPIEKSLYQWCATQRKNKKRGILSDHRIQLLNRLNGWYWDVIVEWDVSVIRVERYIETNGKLPSPESKDDDTRKLGVWCNAQRGKKKSGELSEYKIQKLSSLDGWHWGLDEKWDRHCISFEKFVATKGKPPSALSKDKTEKSLCGWAQKQRRDKRAGLLSVYQIERLSEIDGWNLDPSDMWNDKYLEVKSFVKKSNKIPRSKSLDLVERPLGEWCATQRKKYADKKLSAVQIGLLEKLNHWYWQRDDKRAQSFDDMCVIFEKWVSNTGRFPSNSSRDQNEKNLARWVNRQRCHRRRGKLSEDRTKRLDTVKGWRWTVQRPRGSKTANPKKRS